MHQDDAKTGVITADHRDRFLYLLFQSLPADAKKLKVFTKKGSVIEIEQGMSFRDYNLLLQAEKPSALILSSLMFRDMRVDECTISYNRMGSMILNYRGNAEYTHVLSYLEQSVDVFLENTDSSKTNCYQSAREKNVAAV